MGELPDQSGPRATLRTADRALAILQLFNAPADALTVSEIARRLGLHRSTTSRLCGTLEARGFLERSPADELLRLGPEVARLGRVALDGRDLVTVARPLLAELAERTGETVTLAVGSNGDVLTVDQVDGKHFVTAGNWMGFRTAPHCCSDGKVLLAWGALTLPRGELTRFAPHTIVDRQQLEQELQEVRRRGYALAEGELEAGLVGVAAPVMEAGACVAALCISGPAYRLAAATVTFAPVCQEVAEAIGNRLGGGSRAPVVNAA